MITETPGLLLAYSNRRLPADHSGRRQSAMRWCFSRRLARHTQADRGEGTGRDASPLRQPAARSEGRDRPRHPGCCYEVGEEVREKFESQFAYAAKLFREVEESDPVREKYPMLFLTARAPGHSILPKKIFLDLVEANRQQLLAVGVPTKNIEASPLCTNCRH